MTTYPIDVTVPRLQEFLDVTQILMRRELGRGCDFSQPGDTAIAAMIEMGLQGKTADDMVAFLRESDEWKEKHKAVVIPPRAIVGHVGVWLFNPQDPAYPALRQVGFSDDTGIRRMIGCSNFCALRDVRDKNPVWKTDIQTAKRAGYQWKRSFRYLGCDGPGIDVGADGGYFAGRGVSPAWAGDALEEYCGELAANGLRLQLSCGHQGWTYTQRLQRERLLLEQIKAAGLGHVIWLLEGDNEYWQNAPGRDSDDQMAFYDDLRAMVHELLPGTLFATGAPEDESTVRVLRCAAHGDIVEVHTKRDADAMVRRPFNMLYDDGKFRLLNRGQGSCNGEPTPFAGGPDDFMPTDSPGRQFAEAAISTVMGMAFTYFDGWDVRSAEPLDADAPTFYSIPKMLNAALPETIARWQHVPGGKIFWWQNPDDPSRGVTVFDELWGRETWQTPPRPIARWTAYGPFNSVIEGTGRIDLPPGFGGACVRVEFA